MNHEQIARELLATIRVVEYKNDTGTQYEARLGGTDPVLTGATVISPSKETAVLRMGELVVRHIFNRGTCPHCGETILDLDKLRGGPRPQMASITNGGSQ